MIWCNHAGIPLCHEEHHGSSGHHATKWCTRVRVGADACCMLRIALRPRKVLLVT
jgi:hypothetical protein